MNFLDIIFIFFSLWTLYAYFGRPRVVFREEHLNIGKKEIIVKIEELPEQVYLWNEKTEEFLAQGKDFGEAMARCMERFPGVKFKILQIKLVDKV